MQKVNLNIDELFRHSEELLLIIDKNKNISYMNKKAVKIFGEAASMVEIEHFFSMDVCILDREKILEYTPLSEAVSAGVPCRAEILLQTANENYKKFNLRSFKDSENTIIILSDASYAENEKKITKLERENRDFLQVKERAQNLAVRASLLNRISNSIRDSLNIEEIINIITTEVTATLGLDRGYLKYTDEITDEDQSVKQAVITGKSVVTMVMTNAKTGHIQPRLITPVIYRDNVLGVMVFYHVNNKKTWHEEEISLIEGISSQLASAINQSKAQTQLIQAEKMASLGQLIAGVAHEVNTPLGSINSNNDILSKCIKKISAHDDVLEIANDALTTNFEAIKRINQLVKSLKNFARLDEAEYQETDLREGIKNTLLLINHEIRERVEIVQELGDIPPIKCYPNQLNQVFINILVNAYQSIEGKGKIFIKTEKIDENVAITISDTGHGIPKNKLSRIFDPGYTTKSVGVGTGLGLSICYRIIEKHNGKIHVESEPGKGTSFRIELPV